MAQLCTGLAASASNRFTRGGGKPMVCGERRGRFAGRGGLSETVETAVPRGAEAGRAGAATVLFGVTLFTSAFLMFLIQPMFAKMALPRLGGSSAVWSLALVFFQGVRLLG